MNSRNGMLSAAVIAAYGVAFPGFPIRVPRAEVGSFLGRRSPLESTLKNIKQTKIDKCKPYIFSQCSWILQSLLKVICQLST